MKYINKDDLIFLSACDKVVYEMCWDYETNNYIKIPVEKRTKNFFSIIRIIIEQQISAFAAKAIWQRFKDNFFYFLPQELIDLHDDKLKSIGLSKPKITYIKSYAEFYINNPNLLVELEKMPNDQGVDYLQKIKGIGKWSAALFLLICEGREDLWPDGDIALFNIYKDTYKQLYNKKLQYPKEVLNIRDFDQYCHKAFQPKRSLCAHIMWDKYRRVHNRKRANESLTK